MSWDTDNILLSVAAPVLLAIAVFGGVKACEGDARTKELRYSAVIDCVRLGSQPLECKEAMLSP